MPQSYTTNGKNGYIISVGYNILLIVPCTSLKKGYIYAWTNTTNNNDDAGGDGVPFCEWYVLMMSLTIFATEVKSGLVAKYDQQGLFTPVQEFSFNQYHSNNAVTVRNIITVHYDSIKGREDVQDYIVIECQNAIIEKATNRRAK